jgi:hypothetical protein
MVALVEQAVTPADLEAGRLGEIAALIASAPIIELADVRLEAPIERPPEFLA